MAYSDSTTNYNLPQYAPTDKPTYLVDQNGAWETIDTALKSVSDNAEDAMTEVNILSGQFSSVSQTATNADNKASGALSNEADAYLTTKTYNVGDYAIYGNVLYRCVERVSVAGAFDGSKWTAVKIADEVKRVETVAKDDIVYVEDVQTMTSGTSGRNNVDFNIETPEGYSLLTAYLQSGSNLVTAMHLSSTTRAVVYLSATPGATKPTVRLRVVFKKD